MRWADKCSVFRIHIRPQVLLTPPGPSLAKEQIWNRPRHDALQSCLGCLQFAALVRPYSPDSLQSISKRAQAVTPGRPGRYRYQP